MVRRLVGLGLIVAAACSKTRPMADKVELPHADSAMLTDRARLDSLMDTMPGGRMRQGNDSAMMRLMKKKM